MVDYKKNLTLNLANSYIDFLADRLGCYIDWEGRQMILRFVEENFLEEKDFKSVAKLKKKFLKMFIKQCVVTKTFSATLSIADFLIEFITPVMKICLKEPTEENVSPKTLLIVKGGEING